MVSNEVVLQTVKKMVSTGVDDDTIKMTLRGISLGEDEIDSILREAKGISRPEAEPEQGAGQPILPEDGDASASPEDDSADDDGSEDDFSERLDDVSQEQAAHHAVTHNMLEQHAEKMTEVDRKIEDLHGKIDSTPKLSSEAISRLNMLDSRLSELMKEISETKANTIALQDLLKKILEANRKMLLEQQKKK